MYFILFLFSTLWVGPFWFAMLFKPHDKITYKLMKGPWFFVGPLLIWFFIFIVDFQNMFGFGDAFKTSTDFIQALSNGLANKTGFTATWAHVVVGDIFVTRWIWKRCLSLNLGFWATRLSVFFGVMLMPIGLLLHVIFAQTKK